MGTDTAAPRFRRKEPDARRDEILACAIRLFGEQPYSAVSTAELAREAGVVRGLIHHYFGTKRDLYLEVVRTMMFVPPLDAAHLPAGTVREQADSAIDWLLNAVEAHGRTWVAVAGTEGVGPDAEVQALLDQADDLAAERVLAVMGIAGGNVQRREAMGAVRAFGGMVKAAGREWIIRQTLNRAQTQALLTEMLVALVDSALPRVEELRG
jgi:AcrR family transcriptional regulator